MNRESFVFHHDYIDMEEFSAEEVKMLLCAMIDYSADGSEPSFDDRSLRLEWKRIKTRMDADRQAYEERCEKNRENGKLGGRPKKTETNQMVSEETDGFLNNDLETDQNPTKPKKPDIDSDIDSDIGYKKKTKAKEKKDEFADEVEELRQMYPVSRRGERKKVLQYYKRDRKNGATHEQIKTGLKNYLAYVEAEGTEEKYVKLLTTFMSQSAWQDDWIPSKPSAPPPKKKDPILDGKKGTSFSNFESRQYSADFFKALEGL